MIEEKISDTEHRLTLKDGRQIVLIGTAHVSQNSVEEVKAVIERENPDRICIELDNGRYESKTKEDSWSNMDIKAIFKQGKAFLLLANSALAGYQKRLGKQTGAAPGDEILGAAAIAKEKGIPMSLCDRQIQVTLKRAWGLSGLWAKAKLLSTLLSSVFSKEEIKEEELEELKKSDTLEKLMGELAKELPGAKKALIDERDRYLATSIYTAEGSRKVAVIGAGHAPGIIKTIESLDEGRISTDLSDISEAPKPGPWGKILGWLVPITIVALIIWGSVKNGFAEGLKMFLYWAAVNSGCCFLSAILVQAHPLNWLVAAICSPIAVLNPAVGVGLFTGIAEAKLRVPTVKDFENLSDDSGSFKGWFKNRFLHALVVFFGTSLGSIIGTFVGYPILAKLL